MKARIHSDGGARGNPGPAAIGVMIEFLDVDRPTIEIGETIADTTNNVAEYAAILRGLREAKNAGATDVECILDSELVVRQLTGIYKIRDARLRMYVDKVRALTRALDSVTFHSVPRRENTKADKLVNEALDHAAGKKKNNKENNKKSARGSMMSSSASA